MQSRTRLATSLTALAFAAVACSGTSSATTTETTRPPATTTTTLHNPFLDVVEEQSNFTAGDVVDVVGLPVDEQNWVGSFPADDVEFFGRLWEFDRLEAGLVALGTAASYLDGGVWERFEGGEDGIGHFPQENTGIVGEPVDVTTTVAGLTGDSADDLIALVAETVASAEGGLTAIQITRREFGGREVYYDLIGGDDPLARGARLRIVVEETSEGFGVLLVERATICVADVAESGECA